MSSLSNYFSQTTASYFCDDASVADNSTVNQQAKQLINEWLSEQTVGELTGTPRQQKLDKHNDEPVTLHVLRDYERKLGRRRTSGEENVDEIVERLRHTKIPGVTDDYIKRLAREQTASNSGSGKSSQLRKMEQRHELVAAARRKREEETARRRQELQQRKEEREVEERRRALEEKKLAERKRAEEHEIRLEMNKLRRELSEKRKTMIKEAAAIKFDRGSAGDAPSAFVERKPHQTSSGSLSCNTPPDDERLAQTSKIDILSEEEDLDNREHRLTSFIMDRKSTYRTLKFHFTAWYKQVLTRRSQAAKAQALADWKLLQCAWTAWRSETLRANADRESERYRQHVGKQVNYQRQADEQHRKMVMRKCFHSWRRFVKMHHLYSEAEERKNATRSKMTAFLDAVSSTAGKKKQQPGGGNQKISWMQSTPVKEKFSIAHYNKQKAIMMKQSSIITRQNKMINDLKSAPEGVEQPPPPAHTMLKTDSKPTGRDAPSAERPQLVATPSTERPKWIRNMEERAAERQRRHDEMKERRATKERERRELAEAERRAKAEREEREKREKIRRGKEERRLKEEAERRKKQQAEWLRAANAKADRHYARAQLKYRGLLPLLCAVQRRRLKTQQAVAHRRQALLFKVFGAWHRHTDRISSARRRRADVHHDMLCQRRALSRWRMWGERMAIMERRAELHNNRRLLALHLRRWASWTLDERLRRIDLREAALEADKVRILRRGWRLLRDNVVFERKERARQHRLKAIHMKVMNVLPDYRPPQHILDPTSSVSSDQD